jgi:hypothetical protein
MFGGVARRHGWKDAAVVGLWLALLVGFVAEVTPAAKVEPQGGPGWVAFAQAGQVQARRAPLPLATVAPPAGDQAECRCP